MCVAETVMKREKVTDDAFGDKKFQHQNLNRMKQCETCQWPMDLLQCRALKQVKCFLLKPHLMHMERLMETIMTCC